MQDNTTFWKTRYAPLVGGTITEILVDSDPYDEYVGLLINVGGKQIAVWALHDPEGNGSGFLEMQEVVE